MTNPPLHDPTWYHAVTLVERLASLRAHPGPTSNGDTPSDLAQRRLPRWQSQPPFGTGTYFAQRLAMDQLTESQLLHLLGEPIEAVRDRFSEPLAWLVRLEHVLSRAMPQNVETSFPAELPPEQRPGVFLVAVEPLIRDGLNRLQASLRALSEARPTLPFDPDTVAQMLFAHLPALLISMVSRTLVLELNVARLQGLLQGDAPEERFHSFIQRLRQPEVALAILQEYPVLARQIMQRIDHWVNFSLEFLERLCDDWSMIRATFSPENDPGLLTQVSGGVGDGHRGGRSVLIAEFHSGFRIVYKPKSLAVDVHFQELLVWLNRRSDHVSLRTLNILNRGTYGWTEFVAAQGCASQDEVGRFYERQGAYLGLLYALEATDFHMENLIAAGEHPILIDLESLFHPRVGGLDIHQAEGVAGATMGHSVLRVGLLPQRFWMNEASEGIDLSGLGGAPGQLTPHSVPTWESVGTDEMHFVRKRVELPGSQNRPSLNGADVNALDYAAAIIAGFTWAYRAILEYRDELLSVNGPLARFAEDEVRAILRPTRTYGLLLHESFHPDVLRDALDRERLFDRLWVSAEQFSQLAKAIPAERADLQQLDIPMFTTRPNSRDLWTSTDERIADFFDETGLALVRHRLQQLSEDDLSRQIWFIRASLTSLSVDVGQARLRPYLPTQPKANADREQLLAAARAIGDRLQVLALGDEHEVAWIGLALINERYWSLLPSGGDLYSGSPGIVLFLAYLGEVTQAKRYTDLARAGLVTLKRQIEQVRRRIKSIGAFDGWGSVMYILTHLGTLWNEPDLLTEAEAITEVLPELIEEDEALDIISGTAGCIGSLISLYRCLPSERVLAAAIQCGDRLIARAQPMTPGVGWLTTGAKTKPLTGFSHGAAGIAWALMELAALTGEARFRATALEALAYERSLFSPEVKNWPDLRDPEILGRTVDDDQLPFMVTWCHGAPGIGLARLRTLPYLDDAEIRAEINTALETTLQQGFGLNHSLCHGDLGNLELLLQASQMLGDPKWSEHLNRVTAMILESIHERGWLGGVPLRVETPGLMSGLAGIGYGLLRLAEPAQVPSVLILAPPLLPAAPLDTRLAIPTDVLPLESIGPH